MGRIDDNTLSGSGSPRFGISDENSDDYSLKNRINNPKVASFWMRTMQQNSSQYDQDEDLSKLKLNARWTGEGTSDEATGLSSPSVADKLSDDNSDTENSGEPSEEDRDSSGPNEQVDQSSDMGDNTLSATSSDQEEEEAAVTDDDDEIEDDDIQDSSGEYEVQDDQSQEEENASENNDSEQQSETVDEENTRFSNDNARFAWWTRGLAENSRTESQASQEVTLTSTKKKAALECLTERLQKAIHDGADGTSCLNLVDSIRIVAETAEAPDSTDDQISNSHTTSSKTTDRHSRRTRSRHRHKRQRSPSNREIREGLIALSQFIEHKLDEVTSKTSGSSSTHELQSRSDRSVSHSSSQEISSTTSSSDMSERIRLEKEQKIVQLEQDCSSYKSTIEELKSLINAQNSNLQSTLAALEHMEKDRAEKADAIVVLRETDKKKSDFIVTLQQESTHLRQELDAVHPAALNLQKINQGLHQDLRELKERYEQLKQTEENVTELEKQIATLQTENAQLEADVLSMIKCCTEYKKIIEEVQKRTGPVKRLQPRKGIAQVCSAFIAGEPMTVVNQSNLASQPSSRVNAGCQVTLEADGNAPLPVSTERLPPQEPVPTSGAEFDQEVIYLRNKVHRLEEERDEADDLLYLAKEEKKLLKAELSRMTGDLRKKESRINELEFMLDCETEFSKSTKAPSLECAIKQNSEASDDASTRESFGWFKNVFHRGFSGSSTPNFGSNASLSPKR